MKQIEDQQNFDKVKKTCSSRFDLRMYIQHKIPTLKERNRIQSTHRAELARQESDVNTIGKINSLNISMSHVAAY